MQKAAESNRGLNLVVTGPRGSGKTTVIRRVVTALGGKVVPLWSRPLMADGRVLGFAFLTPDGTVHPFAHVNWGQHPRFMRYGYEPQVFDNLVPALRRWTAGVTAVAYDEVGVMEDRAPEFAAFLHTLLDSPSTVFLAVKQELEGGLTRSILSRADVHLWDLRFVPPDRAVSEMLSFCRRNNLL